MPKCKNCNVTLDLVGDHYQCPQCGKKYKLPSSGAAHATNNAQPSRTDAATPTPHAAAEGTPSAQTLDAQTQKVAAQPTQAAQPATEQSAQRQTPPQAQQTATQPQSAQSQDTQAPLQQVQTQPATAPTGTAQPAGQTYPAQQATRLQPVYGVQAGQTIVQPGQTIVQPGQTIVQPVPGQPAYVQRVPLQQTVVGSATGQPVYVTQIPAAGQPTYVSPMQARTIYVSPQQGQYAQGQYIPQGALRQPYAPAQPAAGFSNPIPNHNWLPVDPSATPCLKIERLSKTYPQAEKPAVHDLSIVCHAGEIVGLLGHNGAGKSTTLKCLTGMLPFDEGSIEINGHDIKKDPVAAKKTFGFVSDKHDVFVKMTGVQYVNFMADAYNVSKQDRNDRIVELDKVFKLGNRLKDPINSYSHGMRQKVCMMGSLIHYPKLWIMDEPMIGLDPGTSALVSEFMLDYASKGNCILFSSHNISSVQKLCKRAVIINHGSKTDDFEFATFLQVNPGINLEEYFLSRTEIEPKSSEARRGEAEVEK